LKTALNDVKVIEYGNLISAPYCSKMLADLGAEVIKIEKPGEGDEARRRQPFLKDIPGIERSGLFIYLNANKMGITLNLESARGKEIFKQLIKDADILIEDTKPGELDELGLGYRELQLVNPSLVMTSLSVFGQTGPYKDYNGNDYIAWHMSGTSYITPHFAGSSDKPPLYAEDQATGLPAITAAVATMMALHWQRRTGIGQHVDVSQLEATLGGFAQFSNMHWPYEHRIVSRASKNTVALENFIKCKDGWVFFHCSEQQHWERLVQAMGSPEWAKEERFKTKLSRGENSEALEELVTEWAKNYTKGELSALAKEKRYPSGPADTIDEVVANPQFKERGFFVEWEHPVVGKLTYPGAPYQFSATPWAVRCPAPLLGQHNEEIYCQRLGYSPEDLASMYQAGII